MRSRFLIFSLFFVLLFVGCTAQKRDPIVGAYSPEDGTDGVYLFLEDGTGARTEYPEPRSVNPSSAPSPTPWIPAFSPWTLRMGPWKSTAIP